MPRKSTFFSFKNVKRIVMGELRVDRLLERKTSGARKEEMFSDLPWGRMRQDWGGGGEKWRTKGFFFASL